MTTTDLNSVLCDPCKERVHELNVAGWESLHEDIRTLAGAATRILTRAATINDRTTARYCAGKADGIAYFVRYLGERYGIDTSDMLKDFDREALI